MPEVEDALCPRTSGLPQRAPSAGRAGGWAAGPRAMAPLLAVVLLSACGVPPRHVNPTTGGDVQTESRSIDELISLGDRVRTAGDLRTALLLYLQASARSKDRPLPWLRIGAVLSILGNCEDAVRSYESALALAPGNVEALTGLGRCQILLGQAEAARDSLTKALGEEAEHPRPYRLLGVALDLLGQHRGAQKAYRSGLSLSPKDVDLRTNLALSLALSGDAPQAVDLVEELLRDPQVGPERDLNLALILSLSKEQAEAARITKAVLGEAKANTLLARFARLRAISDSRERARQIGMFLKDPS